MEFDKQSKWKSQQIDKHWKNRSHGTWYHYPKWKRKSNSKYPIIRAEMGWNNGGNPTRRIVHKLYDTINCHQIMKDSNAAEFLLDADKDQDAKFSTNDFITAEWSCINCTYQNTANCDKCQICEAPNYSLSRKKATNVISTPTLADFLPQEKEQDEFEPISDDQMLQAAIELSYQQLMSATTKQTRKGKRKTHEISSDANDSEIVKASRIEADHVRFYQEKVAMLKKLALYIAYIQNFAICLEIEFILNHYWFKKIYLENVAENVVFIDKYSIDLWNGLPTRPVDVLYDKEAVKELMKSDPIISKCKNEKLIFGYFRNNDHKIYIPYDIVRITTLFSGVIASLLPSINNKNKYFDFGQYFAARNDETSCHTHIYDVCKLFGNQYEREHRCTRKYTVKNGRGSWSHCGFCADQDYMKYSKHGWSDRSHEMYLCVSFNTDKAENDRKNVRFNELIPIMKIQKIKGKPKGFTRKGWLRYRRFDNIVD